MRKIMVDLRKCLGCNTCELACAVQHSQSGDLFAALKEPTRPRYRVRVKASCGIPFPLRCEQCQDAPCIDACKSGAMTRDPETGSVHVDEDTCVGCWMCVMVCPFGAIFPDVERGKAVKCDLCRGHETPACVDACPTGALAYVEPDEFVVQVARVRELGVSTEGK